MNTALGAICYAMIVSVGIALAMHVTGNHDQACNIWAGLFVILFTIGPFVAGWPKQAKKLPGGPWTPEEAQAIADFKRLHPDTKR